MKRPCPAFASTALPNRASVLGEPEDGLQGNGNRRPFKQLVVEHPPENALLVFEKDGRRAFEQTADGLGAQVFEAFLRIVQALQPAAADGVAGEVGKQALGVAVRHEAETRRIFQVDDQVAGVVGHLDQEGQRMAVPGGVRNSLDETGRPRHLPECGGILLVEAEFLAALAVEIDVDQ